MWSLKVNSYTKPLLYKGLKAQCIITFKLFLPFFAYFLIK